MPYPPSDENLQCTILDTDYENAWILGTNR